MAVLNLIINGLPSKLTAQEVAQAQMYQVLNLIINGLPSKLCGICIVCIGYLGFKPYYKWITF